MKAGQIGRGRWRLEIGIVLAFAAAAGGQTSPSVPPIGLIVPVAATSTPLLPTLSVPTPPSAAPPTLAMPTRPPVLPSPRLDPPVRDVPILALPDPHPTPPSPTTLTFPQGPPDCLCPPADAAPKAAPPSAELPAIRPYWNNGLFFASEDNAFLVHLGGSMHYDSAWYTAQPSLTDFPGGTGPFDDGTTPRRFRIRASGHVYEDTEFDLEVEFVNGFTPPAVPSDVRSVQNVPTVPILASTYLTQTNVPWLGNVRVGRQKEPFSLDHLESHRLLPFMERSFLSDLTAVSAFNSGYSPGVSAFRTWADGRVFTHGGAYKNLINPFGFGLGDGNYAVTGRLGFLPIWDEAGERYWYVGGAMSRRDPVNNEVSVRVRNLVRNAPGPLLNVIARTGAIPAGGNGMYNLDTAAAIGPLTVQAEFQSNQLYAATTADGLPQGTVEYHGFYAQALYFLTGEHRPWNAANYTFGRVVPRSNFRFADDSRWQFDGIGAWEIGARYSYLDLNDDAIRGGRLQSVTLGLNWYLNPLTKVQFNYDYLYADQKADPLTKGIVHSFGTRLAFDY